MSNHKLINLYSILVPTILLVSGCDQFANSNLPQDAAVVSVDVNETVKPSTAPARENYSIHSNTTEDSDSVRVPAPAQVPSNSSANPTGAVAASPIGSADPSAPWVETIAQTISTLNTQVFTGLEGFDMDLLQNDLKSVLLPELKIVAASQKVSLETLDLNFTDLPGNGVPMATLESSDSRSDLQDRIRIRAPGAGAYNIHLGFRRSDFCIGTCVTRINIDIPIYFEITQTGTSLNAQMDPKIILSSQPDIKITGDLSWAINLFNFDGKIKNSIRNAVNNSLFAFNRLGHSLLKIEPVTLQKPLVYDKKPYEWVYGSPDGDEGGFINIVMVGDRVRSDADQEFVNEVIKMSAQNLWDSDPVYSKYRNRFRILRVNINSNLEENKSLFLGKIGAGSSVNNAGIVWTTTDLGTIARVMNGLPIRKVDAFVIVVPPSSRTRPHTIGRNIVLGGQYDKSPTSLSYTLSHELGHAIGKLGDEYLEHSLAGFFDYRGDEPFAPNLSSLNIRWNDLSDQHIHYLEGANLFEKGLFRAQESCKMNITENGHFCPVCARAMERAINTGTNSDHLYFTDRIFLDDQMGITFQDQILRFGGYGPRFESKKNCVEGPNHHCGVRYLLNNLNLTDGANRVYRAKLRINGRGGSTELELCRLPNAPDALYVNLVKSTVTTTFKDNSANGRAFYSKIDPQAGSFLAHFDVSAAGFEEVFDPQLGCGPGFSDYIGSK